MTTGPFHRQEQQALERQRIPGPRRILDSLRIPRPALVRSRLAGREEPDTEMYAKLSRLADMYHLGKLRSCYRANKSNSLNYLVTTTPDEASGPDALSGRAQPGRYVFRQHLLSEETVAHEYQVLSHLERQGYPAPRMLLSGPGTEPKGRAWVSLDGGLYSVYAFVEGYRPVDYWWWPSRRRSILRQAGSTLANLHWATAGLEPTRFKWDAYRATPLGDEPLLDEASGAPDVVPPGSRWRNGDLYRRALKKIRSLVCRPSAAGQPDLADKPGIDNWVRLRIDDLERLLERELIVEGRSDLDRVVIHGDYAPWNILMRPDGSLFVLDFNAARLDLRIYDIMLATFWFAWRGDHLDLATAAELQAGYRTVLEPTETEIALAPDVFCWVMGRSIGERLRTHYLENRMGHAEDKQRPEDKRRPATKHQARFLLSNASGLERLYRMCVWAREHPQQLTRGLRGALGMGKR